MAEQALVEQPQALVAQSGPAALLGLMERGLGADACRVIIEAYERQLVRQAEAEFNAALSGFQQECPVILKKKVVEFPTKSGGKFKSSYAEMDSIIEDTRELRAKYRFSHSFDREVTADKVTAICILRHAGGHSTRTPFSVPIEKGSKLSDAHAVASSVTFCERYAFRGALGITTGNDNDGKAFTAVGAVNPAQAAELVTMLEAAGVDEQQFLKTYGVAKVEDLPAVNYVAVQAILQQRIRKAQQA